MKRESTKQRFKIQEFENRSGSTSYRVTGYKRSGERVRDNYAELAAAKVRQMDLELEYLQKEATTQVRATRLTEDQIRIAENCFLRLEADGELTLAVDLWLRDGKKHAVKESVRLDDAVTEFNKWLDGGADGLRDLSIRNLRLRVRLFADGVKNLPLNQFSPDYVSTYLAGRNISEISRDNQRRALSRFFSWCSESPRRWIATNPARREVRKRRNGHNGQPAILTLDECRRMLKAAATLHDGALAPYVAVCLFGGLRPFEAARLKGEQVNLTDGEIRLDATQTKTNRSRTVKIKPNLATWLKEYKGESFFPLNWRRMFDAVKQAAGFTGRIGAEDNELKPYTPDLMRHTAISHFFRDCGSYGLTAEWAGNSEAIIKAHYQGRVTSDDAKEFWSLTPAVIKKFKPAKGKAAK